MQLRAPSPGMIRASARTAFRLHVIRSIEFGAKPMRAPEAGETPLSPAERRFGVERGLIRPMLGEQRSR